MMGLFFMPAHDIHKLKGNEEAPDIPTRILYYLGVVLTDPQIFEIVECLRVGFIPPVLFICIDGVMKYFNF